MTNIEVGIITNSIPLWSLYVYTRITPQDPILVLVIKAPILGAPAQHPRALGSLARDSPTSPKPEPSLKP